MSPALERAPAFTTCPACGWRPGPLLPLSASAQRALAQAEAADGRPELVIDPGRLLAAVEILRTGRLEAKVAEYNTTAARCDCPDSVIRRTVCKHRLAVMLGLLAMATRSEERRR